MQGGGGLLGRIGQSANQGMDFGSLHPVGTTYKKPGGSGGGLLNFLDQNTPRAQPGFAEDAEDFEEVDMPARPGGMRRGGRRRGGRMRRGGGLLG